MTDDSETTPAPDYSFDIDRMDTNSTLLNAHQEGNFIVGQTDKGVRFKQRIPVGKMLNKDEKGNWILQDLRVAM